MPQIKVEINRWQRSFCRWRHIRYFCPGTINEECVWYLKPEFLFCIGERFQKLIFFSARYIYYFAVLHYYLAAFAADVFFDIF